MAQGLRRVQIEGYDQNNTIRFAGVTQDGTIQTADWLAAVSEGDVPRHSFLHKFGYDSGATTSLRPLAEGGIYQTPTSPVSLEFVSSAVGDALNGGGMHSLTIEGLDANWNEQIVDTPAHASNGQIAVNITGTWLRVYRCYVTGSGSYANASTPSHTGTITVRVQGAGDTYAVIPQIVSGFGAGQSLIAAYTVPANTTAYILSTNFSSDVSGTKTCDFFFFKRENADDITNTHSGVMRIQEAFLGTQRTFEETHFSREGYPEKTDIGFMSLASAASKVSASFEMVLVSDT